MRPTLPSILSGGVTALIGIAATCTLLTPAAGSSQSQGAPNGADDAADTARAGTLSPWPESYEILSPGRFISIPFEFYRNKFRFQGTVNGRACNLLLDNGSLWDELLFFGSPRVDSLDLAIRGETTIGAVPADVATGITLAFDDIVFQQQTAVITRYDPDRPNPWEGIDGQVSAAFFKNFVVRIDFDQRMITLIPPGEFSNVGNAQALPMHPGPFSSRMLTADIVMHDRKELSLDLLIDLGGLHALYLPIGRDAGISLPPDAVAMPLGYGLIRQEGYLGTVPSIRLGDYVLTDVPTAFTVVEPDADAYGNTMIGLPLLRRFIVTFDYLEERLILEPAESFDDPFNASAGPPE